MIHWLTRLFSHAKIIITRWLARVFLSVLGITIINLLWVIPALQNVRASASVLALEVANRLRINMEFGLASSLNQLNAIAEQINTDSSNREQIMSRFLRYNANFQNIALVDRNGMEIAHIDREKRALSRTSRNHLRDPFFYVALQNAPNFWSVQTTPEQRAYTTLAVPVTRAGSIVSVIIADLNLNDFIQYGGSARIKTESYVVDRYGNIIFNSDSASFKKPSNVANRALVQKVIVDGREANGLGFDDFSIDKKGENIFTVGVPIALAGWGIFVEQPSSQAFAQERAIVAVAMLAWILGLGIIFIIIRGNYRLGTLNNQLNELLKENYEVGKILVRRDIELTEANTRLMALDINKSEFVSVAAHQLRTPITGIRWSFNTILDRELGDITNDQQKVLEDGLKASIRMIDLINDLLNVARIEEGRFGLRFKKQSFGLIMQSVVDQHKKIFDEKGILFFLDMQTALPPLNLDEEKMSIVLDNIFDNAAKYTPPGGTIMVKVKKEKNNIITSISDTGIGIPKNQIDKLFIKFFRADNALRYQTSGSGLGLYVVKNIIEAHGGTITITSEEGKGTIVTFIIHIPDK